MSRTKGWLIDQAFSELGLASYVYDMTAEERQDALGRLDAMMAEWGGPGVGIRVGWKANVDPEDATLNDESGLADWMCKAVYLNLAVDLASSYGKALPKSTTARAKQAYDALMSACQAHIPRVQAMGNLPAGAGWKRFDTYPFVRPPHDRLTTGPDGLLDFDGEVPV